MVPRPRLILWTLLIVVPFATLAGVVPQSLPIAAALIALFCAAVIVDAASASRRLAGISVELDSPARLQKNASGAIELKITNHGATECVLRIGLDLPEALGSERTDMAVRVPAGAVHSRIHWACCPKQRGQFRLQDIYFERVSPAGFWAFRRALKVDAEIRVYPNLHEERRKVSALFLRKSQPGIRRTRSVGHGREFEKLREYLPGDSVADIHWKVTAKRGIPVTKVYRGEYSQEVYVIIDASRLLARKLEVSRAGSDVTALEKYVAAALILALGAQQQGDRFGLVCCSDRVLTFLRAGSGQAHYNTVRDQLYTLQPQTVSPDWEEVCSTLRLRLRKRALLIFLTDLDDPALAETFLRATDLISKQHLVYVNTLQRPGVEPLFGDGAPLEEGDDLYRHLAGHWRWQSFRHLQKLLQRRGVRLNAIAPDRLAPELLAQYADVRARELV